MGVSPPGSSVNCLSSFMALWCACKASASCAAIFMSLSCFAIFQVHSSPSASMDSASAPHSMTCSSVYPLENFFFSILSFRVFTADAILAIEAWCLSEASLSCLLIISSVLLIRKRKVLSFPLSSLIILSILENWFR